MTEKDVDNLNILIDFFNSEGIEFTNKVLTITFPNGYSVEEPTFYLKNGDHEIEVRYINSLDHKIDYEKRFNIKGIPADYFGKISKEYFDAGKRIFWIKDYEITECEDVKQLDGTVLKDYHRKWEVIKSYLRFGMGKIPFRIYARDCEVKEVPANGPKNEATPFLKTNTFYGNRAATITLGLYLKKDKCGFSKGTLMMLESFGLCFYGNNFKKSGNPDVEVIRLGTKLNCQVIGGSSKLLKHFLENYPTMTKKTTGETFDVEDITYYVDFDHSNCLSLQKLGFDFVRHDKVGFHNYAVKDIDIPKLKVKVGEIFQRKPMIHKEIMGLMNEGSIVSIGNAGTMVYKINRKNYLEKLKSGKIY